MSTTSIRRGDMVIAADTMKPYRIVQVDRERQRVRGIEDGSRTKQRTFRSDRLEEVDEGLWQEFV